MSTPTYQFDHSLTAVKGWMPGTPVPIDKAARLSAEVTITVWKGRVMHLNDAGEFEMGCTGNQMAIFALQNSSDTDVDVTVDQTQGTQGIGGQVMSGLVAVGSYELQTTEFDDDHNYTPNDLLRAQTGNTVQATGGVLTKAGVTLYNTAVCGVVSQTQFKNHHKKFVLTFWPVFCPGTGA
jgi:hypothetical protein